MTETALTAYATEGNEAPTQLLYALNAPLRREVILAAQEYERLGHLGLASPIAPDRPRTHQD